MFCIACVVFTVLAAVTIYEENTIEYPGAPIAFLQVSGIVAMLPFLLTAFLSFIVYAIAPRSVNTEAKNEVEKQ